MVSSSSSSKLSNEDQQQQQQQQQQSSAVMVAPSSGFNLASRGGELSALKQEELNSARQFEARRKQYFAEQYSAHRHYFEALCELMPSHKESTARAVRYVQGRLTAQRAYVDAMCAVNDGVLGVKKGTTKALQLRTKPEQGSKSKNSNSLTHVPSSSTLRHHLVEDMSASDVTVMRALDGLSDFTEKEVLQRLEALALDYNKESDAVIKLGKETLDVMAKVDTHVSDCYEVLQRVVAENLLAPGAGMPGDEATDPVADCWLADMSYRTAVQQQRKGWNRIDDTLRALFERMQALELRRRGDIRGAMENLCAQQESMYAGLGQVTKPVIMAAASISLEPAALEADLKEQMTRGAQRRREENGQSVAPRRNSEPATGVPPRQSASFIDAMPQAIGSPLVAHASILERKKDGISLSAGWTLALGILTKDSYLHIFDIPKSCNLTLSSSTVDAFSCLQPALFEGEKSTLRRKAFREAALIPSITLDLSMNLVAPQEVKKPKHARQFEVVELKCNRGVKAVLRPESRHAIRVRAPSEKDMTEWVIKCKLADVRNGADEEKIRKSLELSIR
jgi:hypothetical protein